MNCRTVVILLLALPGFASAQPTLESLWPNADETMWEYRMTLENVLDPDQGFTRDASLRLSGTVETPGGTAQVLIGSPDLPLDPERAVLAAVWRARPDLRAAIAARIAPADTHEIRWPPLLLHPGWFMKSPSSIQMWQPSWDHPTWTYLRDDLTVGATFTHQLVPELADDVFLHGTVEAIDASVSTLAGTFEHAVRMSYLIDYGWYEGTDERGNPMGLIHSETTGHVHYVPGIGPVDMLEDFVPYAAVDCAPNDCPPEWTDLLGRKVQTITLSLTHTSVAVVPASWSRIKSLYQR